MRKKTHVQSALSPATLSENSKLESDALNEQVFRVQLRGFRVRTQGEHQQNGPSISSLAAS